MGSTASDIRTYSRLSELSSFLDRYNYLRLGGQVGSETFGSARRLNQIFYTSDEWRSARNRVIVRDNGCDLGMEGFDIRGKIYIHHIEPITIDDVRFRTDKLLDPENMICVSFGTHQAIHYGDESLLILPPIERSPNDTCPWKRQK